MFQGVLNIARFRRDPIEFLRSRQRAEGDVFRFALGPLRITFFGAPPAVEAIYSNPKALTRSKLIRVIVPVTGESMLVQSGEPWKKKRITATPVFLPKNIQALAQTMQGIVNEHVARWKRAATAGPVDLRSASVALTMEIVTTALFGRPVSSLPAKFEANIDTLFETVARRMENPFAPPLRWPLPAHRRFHAALADLNQIIFQIVDERIADPDAGDDLLALLLRSMRAEGAVDRRALRDEVITYFIAGFETTATTLAWCFYELGRHPEYIEKIRKDPTFAPAVIQETLRLRPPAWMLDFAAQEDVTVGDHFIPAGEHVWVSQYLTHRHADYWENPEAFQPERFLPVTAKGRHKYAFFPFGASARHCIGQGFALQELQLALITACNAFDWKLADAKPVGSPAGFVLRPGGPVRCHLTPR